MTIIVDFDGTLTTGNINSDISEATPNISLISKLQKIKLNINPYIKICTARGSKHKFSLEEKIQKYYKKIENFLIKNQVPFDEISFNKEYGDLYIDDMTISPLEDFDSYLSPFTRNKLIFTENNVIKNCNTSLNEKKWYEEAKSFLNVPDILFCNDSLLITKKIKNTIKPNALDLINLLYIFKEKKTFIENSFETYLNNIKLHEFSSLKTKKIIELILPKANHPSTFYHGDLSVSNILKEQNGTVWLVDPNIKNVFGSYKTDAGKAFFSFIAYEKNYTEAFVLQKEFGDEIIMWAVAEGLRVVKYRPEYISIVNNIADLLEFDC